MKLIILFMAATLLQVQARVNAQQVTLVVNDATLVNVFKEVRRQTNIDFVYNDQLMAKAKRVSLDLRNVTLQEALSKAFEGQPFAYLIEEHAIVITEKTPQVVVADMVESQAQPPRTRITVVDQQGNPIPNATVSFISKPGITWVAPPIVVGEDGSINLIRAENYQRDIESLRITAVGKVARIVPFPSVDALRIVLQEEVGDIGEVVVTGIFSKPMESFTGSAVTVTAEQLARFGSRNLITSLRNIDPSFNIIESNEFGSDPNRLPEIQVRGNSSIPNVTELQDQTRTDLNTPLIILDGFESSLRALYDLNENEVEAFTLLKDASATAMYGSRGANGVLIVTTVPPKPGKLRLSYRFDSDLQIADLTDYNLMKSREKLELERLAGYYNNARAELDLPLKRYYNFILNEVNAGVETDWLSQPVRNAFGQRHNLRIDGGHQDFRYSASAQYNDNQGVMKGSRSGVFNGTITLSYVYQNLRFRNYTQLQERRTAESPYGSFSDYAILNPYWRIHDENGDIVKQLGHPGNFDYNNYWTSLPTNPLYNATLNTFDKGTTSALTNNTTIEYYPIRGMKLVGKFGISKDIGSTDRFRPGDHTAFASYTSENIFRKGDYRYGVSNALRYDGGLTAEYSRSIGKHVFFSGLDFNVRQNGTMSYSFLVEGFNNANFDFLPMALQYSQGGKPSGTESLTRAIGYTGSFSYIYDTRYTADATVRLDGSSQYGSNRKFAPFWSVGAAWNVHNEQFLKDNSYVTRLRLRASVGVTGSQQFAAYQALSTYAYYLDDRYFNWNGAYLMGLGNPDLRWQSNRKNNVGMEIDLFRSYLRIVADYYVETTDALVSSVNLPASNGFPSYIDNIGSLRNRGFETKVTVFLLNQSSEGLVWSVTGGIYQNRNEILKTSQALKDAQEALRASTTNFDARIYEEGYSSNTIWAVPSLGIDPSTGKELYLGADGIPTYTWNGQHVTAVGSTDPKLYGNFNTFFRYKDFQLTMAFGYRFGGQQYNQTLVNKVETNSYKYNVDARVYNSRWIGPGDVAAFKGILVTTPTYKTSRFVQDENTLTLQNINFNYTLRNLRILSALRMQSLDLTANFADVFHISTIRRERGTAYPFARQLSFSVRTTF